MIEYYCKKCDTSRDESLFYKRNERVVYPCKICKKQYYEKWKSDNPKYHEQWKQDHPERESIYNKNYRVKFKEERKVLRQTKERAKDATKIRLDKYADELKKFLN